MSQSVSPSSAAVGQLGSVVKAKDVVDFVFVTRPASGAKEGEEHKKLMFFWPKKETVDFQVRPLSLPFLPFVFSFFFFCFHSLFAWSRGGHRRRNEEIVRLRREINNQMLVGVAAQTPFGLSRPMN